MQNPGAASHQGSQLGEAIERKRPAVTTSPTVSSGTGIQRTSDSRSSRDASSSLRANSF